MIEKYCTAKIKLSIMSINLLETVQKNSGYPALQKIDPNTQAVVADDKTPDEHKFSQAAIPAILTALYKYVQADEGAAEFLRGDSSTNWVSKIFPGNKKEVVQAIAAYSQQLGEDPVAKMNAIADETVKLVKENLPDVAAVKDVKIFFSKQRNNILLYLPAVLNMGELLHDDTLDDNTNKMEGPISSLMHSIGAAFSTPVAAEEIKNP
jgi:copper chaperone CopZ